MKKLVTMSLVLFSLCIFSSSIFAQDEEQEITENNDTDFSYDTVNSYDLFWPIVAGKVPGDSMYFLKPLKEKITRMVIFSDIRKSDHHLFLSKKRLVETEKLLIENKDYPKAEAHIDKCVNELELAMTFAKKADEKDQSIHDLRNAITENGEREIGFLKALANKIPEDEREHFNVSADSMEKLVSDFGSN